MALFDEWMVRRVQSQDSLREEKTKRSDRERTVIANFINKPVAFVESQNRSSHIHGHVDWGPAPSLCLGKSDVDDAKL